jgi:hypothetical protein
MDLADYYKQYYNTMQHWHTVLPGKVLDVHYEETVSDLESQVRRILEHCGLPFEDACVRFHETDRAVKTASSEQVRPRKRAIFPVSQSYGQTSKPCTAFRISRLKFTDSSFSFAARS